MNRHTISKSLILLITALAAVQVQTRAAVRLPHILGDNMVLQRGVPLPVWGWADPGEQITVCFADHEAGTKADAEGKWKVTLPAAKSGGPYEMTISGKNTLKLTNILVGEVWICSGQSNMAWSVGGSRNGKTAIPAEGYPQMRLFKIPKTACGTPMPDVEASWQPCIGRDARKFSAVGFYFGREIQVKLEVPVGLIQAAWGSTPIEAWTPREGFSSVPELKDIVKQIDQADAEYRKEVFTLLDGLEAWVRAAKKAREQGGSIPSVPNFPQHPFARRSGTTGPWNGMVNPLIPFAIRGVIWYQGEYNVGGAATYYHKMKALIGGWRSAWNQEDVPFYFVQLAPHTSGSRTAIPEMWEAQTAALAIPGTGMAVIHDLVENPRNIHPRNKLDVGKRLALWALARTYNRKNVVCSGPLFESMAVDEGKIRISFKHVGSGLATRDGKAPDWFEVAGADKKFVKAQARIDGNTVLVWSEKVPAPVGVRYGWHKLAQPNLINKEGLPASPFRTHRR